MKLYTRLVVSTFLGLGLTGVGLGFIHLGGWGPCRPASTLAHVGGIFSFYHVTLLCTWIPGLGAVVDSLHCDLAALIIIPTIYLVAGHLSGLDSMDGFETLILISTHQIGAVNAWPRQKRGWSWLTSTVAEKIK